MSFKILSNDMYSEIQYTLLEVRNGGVSYGSGLYTADEVADRLNHRLREFYKRTAIVVKRDTTTTTTVNTRDQSCPSNLIDIVRLGIQLSCGSVPTSELNIIEETVFDGSSAATSSLSGPDFAISIDAGGPATSAMMSIGGGTP